MFGITDYGAFCAAILLFLALPGPGTFALLTSTGKGGLRAGAAATFGVIAGDQVLLWLAVAGVAALLAAYPAVFKVVQYAGAAYLAWIGLKLLLSRGDGSASPIHIEPPNAVAHAPAPHPGFASPTKRDQGGVQPGKTTTTVNLAAGLAKIGQRVLMVDLDPQGNATMGSGVDKRKLELTVYDVLLESASVREAPALSDKGGYDVLGANRELAGAEVELVALEHREKRLKAALAAVAPTTTLC
jgi:hypothetical protein